MSQFVETACRADTAAGALGQYLRVKTPGALALAGATDVEIGTMELPCLAAGPATVRLRTAQGTRKMVAAGAITAGNPVYAAANGTIDASGTVYCGTALETSADAGDIIEVLPGPNTDISAAITGTTAAAFVVDSDSSAAKVAINTNSATGNFTATIVPANLSGNITLTLPAATGTLATLAGAETLSNKTLGAGVVYTVATVNAAGSVQGNAAALTGATVSIVDGADNTKGVVLPAAAAGVWCKVYSSVAANGLKVYPAANDDINDGTANAAVVIEGRTWAEFVAVDDATWMASYTANS